MNHRVATGALLLVLALGCAVTQHPMAYQPPVPEADRRAMTRIEATSRGPEGGVEPRFDGRIGKAKGAVAGFGEGAVGGALGGLYVAAHGGPIGLVLVPILVPAGAAVGAVGGTIWGGVTALPAREGQAASQALAAHRRDLSADLAQRLTSRLPRPAMAAPEEDSSAGQISVSVERWGLEVGPAWSDPMSTLVLRISYQVTRPGKKEVLLDRSFEVGGQRLALSAWTANQGAALSRTVDDALDAAAEAILDSVLRIQDFHLPQFLRWDSCGLAPVSVSEAESGRPWLAWEPFPRAIDREQDALGLLSHLSRITYDLRIWEALGGGPRKLLYQREGIEEARHHVDEALPPHARYLWSVRARFLLDGEERLTRWSTTSAGSRPPSRSTTEPSSPCREDGIPPGRYHAFELP